MTKTRRCSICQRSATTSWPSYAVVDSPNLRFVNGLRLVNDDVVVLSPIERIPPFDAVLSALFAEYEGHRSPTLRACIRCISPSTLRNFMERSTPEQRDRMERARQ